jgi:tripartite-type tricarboxylate transporter receptor subunit TctC
MKKLLALLFITASSLAMAGSYPNKPVKIVLCLGAGSGPDVMARKMAEVLTEKWKQPVIIENKPGGGGIVGLNYLNNEPADGYTIGLLDGGSMVSYPILNNGRGADLINKLEPVRPLFNANMAVFTSGTNGNTLTDIKNEIIKNPSYGSWNVGSAGHVLGAEFASFFTDKATHVPYKDFGIWQTDVANRTLSYSVGSVGSTKGLVQSGKNQLVAIASKERDPTQPNVPTVKELTGHDMTTIISWVAFYVPANAPASIKTQLAQDLTSAAKDPRVQESLNNLSYIPLDSMSVPKFKQLIRDDTAEYKRIVKKFNIGVQ